MGAEIAEHADRVGVGLQPCRQVAVLDQPLQQVLQRPRPGRLVDPPLVDLANHPLQDLAGAGQGHLGVELGHQHGLADAVAKFGPLARELLQTLPQ